MDKPFLIVGFNNTPAPSSSKKPSVVVSTFNEDEDCAICMNLMTDRCIVQSCQHVFCHGCILKWAQSRRVCPLCNVDFEVFIVNVNGRFQEERVPVPSTATKEVDTARELECLDHSYFVVESKRLLIVAQNVQQSMARQTKQQHRAFVTSWETSNLVAIEGIVTRLGAYVALFESDVHFDAHTSLQELYQIQDQIQELYKNPFTSNVKVPVQEQLRYSADDFDELSDDSADEVEYYQAPKMKGKNNHNNKNKKKKPINQYY